MRFISRWVNHGLWISACRFAADNETVSEVSFWSALSCKICAALVICSQSVVFCMVELLRLVASPIFAAKLTFKIDSSRYGDNDNR